MRDAENEMKKRSEEYEEVDQEAKKLKMTNIGPHVDDDVAINTQLWGKFSSVGVFSHLPP